MGHLYEALKAGPRGFKLGSEPSEVSIAGRTVKCPHLRRNEVHAVAGVGQHPRRDVLQRGLGRFGGDRPDVCGVRPDRVVRSCADGDRTRARASLRYAVIRVR